MYAFIQTGLIYNIAMLVFLPIVCCGATLAVAEILKPLIRRRK